MWGFDTLLYTGDTLVTPLSGANASYTVTLRWVGPRLPPAGRATMTVVLGAVGTVVINGNMQGDTLFYDNFDSAQLLSQWISVVPKQWIDNGWLCNQEGSWVRDAMALVHDADQNWQNFTVEAKIMVIDSGYAHCNILLHANKFIRSSAETTGSCYQLEFVKGFGGGPDGVYLTRTDMDNGGNIQLISVPWQVPFTPFTVRASINGGRIQVWIDNVLMIDITDPNPLPYGGVGIHNIWESESKCDYIAVVKS
jgi:hypothetical protein